MRKIGNRYTFKGDYVIITILNKMRKVLGDIYIDKEDYDKVCKHTWYISSRNYAFMTYRKEGERRRWIQLHRFIMEPPRDMDIDHKNRNRLDCRKGNLRIATNAQNRQNLAITGQKTCRGKRATSKYRGVSFCSDKRKWRAQCQIGGRRFHIGWFTSEVSAALAVKKFRQNHMPFSRT